jgi:Ca2+-binding RTX toxin-like protein
MKIRPLTYLNVVIVSINHPGVVPDGEWETEMRTVTWTVGSTTVTTNISDTATSSEVRVAIQTALDDAESAAASAGQPATVTLSAGTFTINGDGTASHGGVHVGSNVTLQGTTNANGNQTTIKLDSAYTGTDVTGIVRTDDAAGVHDVTIKNLIVEGNGTTQTAKVDGVYAGYYGDGSHTAGDAQVNITIDGVEVRNCSRYGIDPHEQITGLTIINSVAHNNKSHGFVLDFVEGGWVEGNESYENGEHGFALVTGSHDIVLVNNNAHDNTKSGIFMGPPDPAVELRPEFQSLSSYNITISGGQSIGNGRHGVELSSSQHVTVQDMTINGNDFNGVNIGNSTINTSAPTSDDISVHGNLIFDNTLAGNSSYDAEVRVRDNAGNVEITGNQLGDPASPATYELSVSATGNSSSTIVVDENRYEDGTATLKAGTPAIFDNPASIGAITYNTGTSGNNVLSFDTGRQYARAFGGDDTVSTGADRDSLLGGDGNDSMDAGSGDDFLFGGAGDDTVDGGLGADRLHGGRGNDLLIVDNTNDKVFDAFNFGTDLVQSSVTFSISASANIENLTLIGSSAINGTGNAAANVLIGNTAANTLTGNSGADTEWGGNGADTLNGNANGDSLYGQSGGDTLTGGAGKDQLTGGNGNDTFKFTAVSDSGTSSSTRDVISDFSSVSGNDDIIDVSGIDADSTTAGNQAFSWIGNAALSGAGQLRYYVSGGNTIIQGSTDADSSAEFTIELTGTPALTAADFIL